jgi:uncharacterized protein with GYD domain
LLFFVCFKIATGKFKEVIELASRWLASPPPGFKVLRTYYTLGRYDAIWILEAPNEKEVLKQLVVMRDVATTETWAAISREEALKLMKK